MRKLYPLHKYLLVFFVATILVGELKAQQKLTENFWIRCSNEPRFGPKIEYLININTETNTWQQKMPNFSTFYICENSDDVIRYKKSRGDDCSGFGSGFFSKWTGKLNDKHEYLCQVLTEEPKPLYN